MSDINDIPCISAQLLEEVRLYLDKYYEEPAEEELFLMQDSADHMLCDAAEDGAVPECEAASEYEAAPVPGLADISGSAPQSEKRSSRKFFGRGGSGPAMKKESSPREDFTTGSAAPMMAAAMSMQAQDRKLEDVIGDLDKSFMELVYEFADRKGITDPELQKRSLIDRKAYSKLKCGTSKNPSKSTALALAIGLELNLDDTKDLLSRAGFALSPCSKQDLIIRYFIEKEIYDMDVINYTLDEYGEPVLGSH